MYIHLNEVLYNFGMKDDNEQSLKVIKLKIGMINSLVRIRKVHQIKHSFHFKLQNLEDTKYKLMNYCTISNLVNKLNNHLVNYFCKSLLYICINYWIKLLKIGMKGIMYLILHKFYKKSHKVNNFFRQILSRNLHYISIYHHSKELN